MKTETNSTGQPPPAIERRGWGWQKAQAFGAFGVLVTMVIVSVLFGGFDPFMAILVGPFVVGLLLRLRFRRVGTVFLGVAAVALTLMNLPFLLPSLRQPAAGVDFVLPVVLVMSMLTVVVTTVPAYREVKRGVRGSTGPKVVPAVATLLVVALSAWGLIAYATYPEGTARPGDVNLTTKDHAFKPEQIEAGGGQVAVYIRNEDDTLHTFTIDKLGVDVYIPAHKTARVSFPAGEGSYRFYCRPHAPDMEGKLVVG
ncbi:MAG: cupredoxin domain-containing protein [Actinomycetota bacterium]